jgi:uncharacterized membrane protein YbjE (DUF340 family)
LAALDQARDLQQIARHRAETAFLQALRQPAVVKAVQDKVTPVVVVVLVVVQVVEQVQPEERLRLHRRKATTAAIIQRETLQALAVAAVVVLARLVEMEAETIQTEFQVQAVQD